MTSADEADFLDDADADGAVLLADLKEMIFLGAQEMPRNQQKHLGPSEIDDCDRRLVLGMLEIPHCNPDYDPLKSLFGTGMHGLMEGFAHAANKRLGRIRFVAERRVSARPVSSLSGTSDLLDLDTLTVVDYKCPAPTAFKKYIEKGPSSKYRRQLHIYGYGYWRTFGVKPKRVAIYWIPQGGTVSASKLWCEPFDASIAEAEFERMDNLALIAYDLDLEHHPERVTVIPATPDDGCMFCPYFSNNPQNGHQCGGV